MKKRNIIYGIQGGRGSFNEEAIRFYTKEKNINKYQIKYLFTSKNVMRALNSKQIDIGQFAIHNSVGGIVDESIEAMGIYKFKIADQFAIKISHALMIRPDAKFSDINTIMTHPQVLAQCKGTLTKKYPRLKQISGKGNMIDSAVVAKYLGERKLPKYVAVMGSAILADIYNLKIIEDGLEDAKENYTSFIHVARL